MTSPTSPAQDEVVPEELLAMLRSIGKTIAAEQRIFVRYLAAACAIGLLIAFGSRSEFTASAKLLPYKGGSGGNAGLSGLAGLAGIRLPVGIGDQTISADLYPELTRSQEFRILVAETPLRFSSLNQRVSTVKYFGDLATTSPVETVLDFVRNLPPRVASLAKAPQDDSVRFSFKSDTGANIPFYNSRYLKRVNVLSKRLIVSVDKKTSVITLSGTMPDPYAAADLVRVTSELLMKRVIDVESRKAMEQFRFVSEQLQRARWRLERAQRELAVFSDRNRVIATATSRIEQERLQRENDLSFELYQQLSREVEQARVKMSQDTPIFTVLDQVVVPAKRSSPHRARILIISLLSGLLAGLISIIGRRILHTSQLEPL